MSRLSGKGRAEKPSDGNYVFSIPGDPFDKLTSENGSQDDSLWQLKNSHTSHDHKSQPNWNYMSEPFHEQTPGQPAVRGFLHRAEKPSAGLVLTHGAGGNCNAPLLVALAEALCAGGITVLRCDLPFRQARPHGPPIGTSDLDQAGLLQAVHALQEIVGSEVFLGGHSYGGRMATMLAAQEPSLDRRLLLLSYPLHPPRRPTQLRTAHFPKLQVPALFVHGTRDPFGSVEEMQTALALIPAPTKLLPIEGAGHDLLQKRKAGTPMETIVKAFLAW